MTSDGEVIFIVDDEHYALFPWVFGHHRAGAEMSVAQLEVHGQCLGDIHLALNDVNAYLPHASTQLTLAVHGLEATLNDVSRVRELVAEKWRGNSFERLVSESLTQDWVDVRAFAADVVRSAFKVFVSPDGRGSTDPSSPLATWPVGGRTTSKKSGWHSRRCDLT